MKLNDTRLIMMEGLPSAGKSTNAGILLSQLERNGRQARWIHEVARPHPTLFFYEAYMDDKEYIEFIARHPGAASLLERLLMRRNNGVGIDLLDVEWNYREQIGSDALADLKKHDVWNFDLERYKQAALEKWGHFVEQQLQSDEIAILDSSIFQFQIYSFLLADAPFAQLQSFIEAIYKIISPLNPSLVYLHRNNTEDTIDYLVKDRGTEFLERIWERDKHHPYYRNRPAGADGYKMFLRDYGKYAGMLFDSAPVRKLSLEITEGNWKAYEETLLDFVNLPYVPSTGFTPPSGVYLNEELHQRIEIVEGEYLITPGGGRKRLLPKSGSEFYIHDLPVIIRADGDYIIIEGEQLCDRWTTTGTVFRKEEEDNDHKIQASRA